MSALGDTLLVILLAATSLGIFYAGTFAAALIVTIAEDGPDWGVAPMWVLGVVVPGWVLSVAEMAAYQAVAGFALVATASVAAYLGRSSQSGVDSS